MKFVLRILAVQMVKNHKLSSIKSLEIIILHQIILNSIKIVTFRNLTFSQYFVNKDFKSAGKNQIFEKLTFISTFDPIL
jgi:hypothetical protein